MESTVGTSDVWQKEPFKFSVYFFQLTNECSFQVFGIFLLFVPESGSLFRIRIQTAIELGSNTDPESSKMIRTGIPIIMDKGTFKRSLRVNLHSEYKTDTKHLFFLMHSPTQDGPAFRIAPGFAGYVTIGDRYPNLLGLLIWRRWWWRRWGWRWQRQRSLSCNVREIFFLAMVSHRDLRYLSGGKNSHTTAYR